MATTLFSLAPSHPAHSARLMLEHKGIEHRVIDLPPGSHAAALRPLGFRRGTVPALKMGGRRAQTSLEISRFLEEVRPDPPLFPADPVARAKVEDAERWGDEMLQPVPRLVARWLARNGREMRVHMAREAGIPLPAVVGPALQPVAGYFARKVGADDTERVRAAVADIPALLDRVEELMDEGTIAGEAPNAADFQIVTSVRSLISSEDLAPAISPRRSGQWALETVPDWPTSIPAGFVPGEWLAPLRD